MALAIVALIVTASRIFYDTPIPSLAMFMKLASGLVLAGIALSIWGINASNLIRTSEAAMPITNAIVLPIMFFSGILLPVSKGTGLARLVRLLPVADVSMIVSSSVRGQDLRLLHVCAKFAAAGAVGVLLLPRFRWTPKRSRDKWR